LLRVSDDGDEDAEIITHHHHHLVIDIVDSLPSTVIDDNDTRTPVLPSIYLSIYSVEVLPDYVYYLSLCLSLHHVAAVCLLLMPPFKLAG